MVKLSQQINGGETQRVTRTDIVKSRQQYQKERREFDELKTRATAKQKEFEGIKTIDEYEQKYTDLDPSLKQFFKTPTTLKSNKVERINETKQLIKEKQTFADGKITWANERRATEVRENDAWYKANSSKEGASAEHKQLRHDIEDDWEERIAKWQGYKKGLTKGWVN